MADIQRTIVAKLRLDEEGDAELFGKTADEIAKMQEASKSAGVAAEGLGKSFEQGTRAVESGSTRASAAVERIGVSLANYREQIKAAEAAGATIADEQIAELQRLEAEYEKAVVSVGKLRTAQQQAKRDIDDATEAAGGQAERINGLDDIVRKLSEDLGPGAVKWLSWGTAAVGAFTAGYAAGEKLLGVLDRISNGQASQNIQEGFIRQLAQLGITFDQTTSDAEAFRNQLNILRNKGIDPTGMSAEEVGAKVRELGLEMQLAGREASAGEKQIEKFFGALPTAAEITSKAEALGVAISKFQEANRLSPPKLKELFGAELQAVLDEIHAKGIKVPDSLKIWTDGLKILPTSLDDIRKQVVSRIDALFLEFGGKPEQLLSVQQRVAEINAALAKLGHVPTGEGAAAVKKLVQAIVDEVRAAKGRIDPDLGALADRFGVVTTAIERVGGGMITLSARSIPTTEAALARFQGGLNDTATSADKLGSGVGGVTTKIPTLEAALKRLQGGLNDTAEPADVVAKRTHEAATAAAALAKEAATSEPALRDIASRMKEVAGGAGEAAGQLPKVKTEFSALKKPAEEVKAALAEIPNLNIAGPLVGQIQSVGTALDDLLVKVNAVITGIRVGLAG